MSAELKPMIGLEIHVQLNTASKLFCSCPTQAEEPNSACCEICLGMPGSKPSLNENAVEMALKTALSFECKINREFYFSRKTYFYPDLAKDFQITQFEIPLGESGVLRLKAGKEVRIRRVHLEEDPAALVHESGISSSNYSLIDYNRSGIPLLEIVTEPDLESPEQAREFLDALLNTINYLGVFVQGKNVLKVDTNISIKGFERVEVKNVNGFKAVEDALKFEIERQRQLVSKGEKPARETRSFDEATGKTRSLRSKETEDDYGYIFEPDLPVVEVSEKKIQELKKALPELPGQKIKRLMKEKGLAEYDARVLSSSFSLGNLYDSVSKTVDARLAAKFLTRELLAILNHDAITLEDSGVDSEGMAKLLKMLQDNEITEKAAKEALIIAVAEKKSPENVVRERKLSKESLDSKALENACGKAVSENPKAVEDFSKGSEKALNFLLGTAMRSLGGKADARELKKILEKILEK